MQHDFDFLVGTWDVHHRRLITRLAGSTTWETFSGTCTMTTLMAGHANLDDNVLELPGGSYRAVTLRAFDAASATWAIWWLDGRTPHTLDPPVRGRFEGGVGTFEGEDTLGGRPIRVRFVWSAITRTTCRWAQAFSADAGATWEPNWEMAFVRRG